MRHKYQANQFSKFLEYVLGRRPDEFGLVPDHEGFVKIKDLIKALSDEDGWRHIRLAHIQEIFLQQPDPPFEMTESLIRVKHRDNLPVPEPCEEPPKLLYGWVRKKAWPFVFQNGLAPSSHPFVLLVKDRDFAHRLAKRLDLDAVIVNVMVQNCMDNGLEFQVFGDLYCTGFLPVDCFTGPPLPKEKEESKSKEKPVKKPSEIAGSFFLDMGKTSEKEKSFKRKGKRDDPSWKQDRRRIRKEKERY